jgi:hypothetical protein
VTLSHWTICSIAYIRNLPFVRNRNRGELSSHCCACSVQKFGAPHSTLNLLSISSESNLTGSFSIYIAVQKFSARCEGLVVNARIECRWEHGQYNDLTAATFAPRKVANLAHPTMTDTTLYLGAIHSFLSDPFVIQKQSHESTLYHLCDIHKK